MGIRSLSAIVIFQIFTALAFGQAYINFNYYNCFEGGDPPMTNGPCWQGTPIPNGGATIYIYEYPNTLLGPNGTFNGEGDPVYCEPGYFAGSPPITWYVGRQVYAVFEYQGCTYSTINHLWTTILYDNAVETTQDWWDCNCGPPPCTPTEDGVDGPYNIPMNSTKVFFSAHDSCTVWVTAQGGTAHGVTAEVFDAVPGFHPVAFNYMSRIVAVYWDGSVDPATSLLVRMYYESSELGESGFSGASCLIAARFDEFAAKWSPIPPTGSGSKYIEFVTDRSGYFTFDCRGTAPRGIPIGDPAISSGDRELVVRWQTVDEFENYRFHILRAEKSEGPYLEIATVNSQLPDIGTTASYNYEYRDPGLENGRTYYYRLGSEDLHGNTVDGLAAVSGVPSLYGDAVQIDEYRLHAAYPNPFNPETRITYDVRDAGRVTLCVFDILGREVARLVDGEQPRGRYSVSFNARDLPSGLYFYRIDIGGQFTSTQKMLLLK